MPVPQYFCGRIQRPKNMAQAFFKGAIFFTNHLQKATASWREKNGRVYTISFVDDFI
jgi:hypothetical protein